MTAEKCYVSAQNISSLWSCNPKSQHSVHWLELSNALCRPPTESRSPCLTSSRLRSSVQSSAHSRGKGEELWKDGIKICSKWFSIKSYWILFFFFFYRHLLTVQTLIRLRLCSSQKEASLWLVFALTTPFSVGSLQNSHYLNGSSQRHDGALCPAR